MKHHDTFSLYTPWRGEAEPGWSRDFLGTRTREAFWRTAIGKMFTEGGFYRTWTPIVEVVAARELVSGAKSEWDVVPQMQVSLSKRRHILVSGGVQIPVNARADRHPTVLTYFLWDWYEGGLFDGWK